MEEEGHTAGELIKVGCLPAVMHAVWAGLAAGYYTPRRAV